VGYCPPYFILIEEMKSQQVRSLREVGLGASRREAPGGQVRSAGTPPLGWRWLAAPSQVRAPHAGPGSSRDALLQRVGVPEIGITGKLYEPRGSGLRTVSGVQALQRSPGQKPPAPSAKSRPKPQQADETDARRRPRGSGMAADGLEELLAVVCIPLPESGPRNWLSAWKIPRNCGFPRSGGELLFRTKKPASRATRAVVAMCSFRV
jgi:hypothetical protein